MRKFMTNFLFVALLLLGVAGFIATLALPAFLAIVLDNEWWLFLILPIVCIWVALMVTIAPTHSRTKK